MMGFSKDREILRKIVDAIVFGCGSTSIVNTGRNYAGARSRFSCVAVDLQGFFKVAVVLRCSQVFGFPRVWIF